MNFQETNKIETLKMSAELSEIHFMYLDTVIFDGSSLLYDIEEYKNDRMTPQKWRLQQIKHIHYVNMICDYLDYYLDNNLKLHSYVKDDELNKLSLCIEYLRMGNSPYKDCFDPYEELLNY